MEPQRALGERKERGSTEVRGDDKCHIRTMFPISAICSNKMYHCFATMQSCFSYAFLPSISDLDTPSMSSSTLAPVLFITSHPSNGYGDSSRSSKIPSSGNTRSIHLGHTDCSPTSRDDLITEISRSTTRPRPVDVILCQDHSDLGVCGRLGKEGCCACEGYMGWDGGAGA